MSSTGPIENVHIIGIAGRAGVGKDALAKSIIAIGATATITELYSHDGNLTIHRFAFADCLKEALKRVDARLGEGENAYSTNGCGRLPESKAKRVHPELRTLYQEFGSAVRRVDEYAWIRSLRDQIEAESWGDPLYVVIPDVRYENEAEWILKHKKSTVVFLEGDGDLYPELNQDHESEAFAWRETTMDLVWTDAIAEWPDRWRLAEEILHHVGWVPES